MARTRARGFAVVLLLIALLIVGVLAVIAVSQYHLAPSPPGAAPDATSGGGGITAAKTTEAKQIAGVLWTALRTSAMAACGTPITVRESYVKAGLTTSGDTLPPRWSIPSGGATLVAECATGAYAVSDPILFTVEGTAADVDAVRVQLEVDSPRGSTRLLCSTDRGATFDGC